MRMPNLPILTTLTALALLACATLAQDGEEPVPNKKKKENPVPAKPPFRVMGGPVSPANGFVKSIIEDLESGEKKRIERAMRKLKSMHGGVGAAFQLGTPLMWPGGGLRIQVDRGGGESMSGSFSENGKKGTYQLTSTGNGGYKLAAKLLDGETVLKEIKDQGTFSDLRKKYKFLGSRGLFVATAMPGFDLDAGTTSVLRRFVTGLPQPIIGVVARPATETLRHHLELPTGGGVVLDKILPGSRAERIGLKQHDILVRIDGTLVDEAKQVRKLAKDGVKLELIRRGKRLSLTTGRRGNDKDE